MPQAIIFDIDGTLVDSVDFHAQAWVKAFEHFGYQAEYEQMRQQIGKGGDYILPVFLSQSEIEQDGSQISQYRKQFYQEHLLPKVQPFPQVRALFEQVRADGKRIVLASSGQPETVEHYKSLLQVEDLIDGATSTGDVEHAKPNPDIFLSAMEHFPNLDPSDILVVGDSPYDAEAAGKIPLQTIGVLCGGFSEATLREAGCTKIYQDPADLLAHYSRSPLHENGVNKP